jgi:hypothetical protein
MHVLRKDCAQISIFSPTEKDLRVSVFVRKENESNIVNFVGFSLFMATISVLTIQSLKVL